MKTTYRLLLLLSILLLTSTRISAQITNLKVNGVTNNFSVTQGQALTWECNLPVGGVLTCEIWIDLNGNGVIDPGVDKSMFGVFTQTDGDISGNNGPGDMDSLKNGHILLYLPGFNFAPGKYVFKFSNGGTTLYVTGTVAVMPSPVYTIAGKVTPPSGISAQNILVSGEAKDQGDQQSFALTDASGNYVINFGAIAGGITFRIKVKDDFTPSISSPTDTSLTLTKSYTGINFVFAKPMAKIVGYLKGEDSHIFQNADVGTYPYQGGGNFNKGTKTDANGYYQLGYSASELAAYSSWRVQGNGDGTNGYIMPQSAAITISPGDSIRVDLKAYVANSTIQGKVTVDGGLPPNISFSIFGSVEDTAFIQTSTDPVTGAFTLPASNKLYNYYIGFNNLPSQYGYNYMSPSVHPGDNNLVVSLKTLSWQQQNSGTGNTLNTVDVINPTTAWVAGANGTILKTTDAGNSWQTITMNNPVTINSIFFLDALTGWGAGESGVLKKTTDGGANWTKQTTNTTMTIYQVQFLDANNGWAVGGTNGTPLVLRTTNGGSTWNAVSPNISGNITALSMANTTTGWAVCSYILYKTTDGGLTWNKPLDQNALGVVFNGVKFVDANNGWAVGMPGAVYHTTDGGSNWTSQNANFGSVWSIYCLNASKAWICGDNGNIFYTTDAGNNWNQSLTNVFSQITAVGFCDANNGWAVGMNGTILHTTNGGVTDIQPEKTALKAAGFTLQQNYPNPFNPETQITYSLATAGKVTLRVYDALGRLVTTLLNETQNAGSHTVQFNGSRMASGVYFYSLQSGNFMQTRKMLLLK